MIDYDFYQNAYLGSVIPEKAFPAAARRAGEALENIKRKFQVRVTDGVSEKMAVCAMAETVYEFSSHSRGLASAKVGEVSVQYATARDLSRELLQKARIYLDIYRGAIACSAL